jgi:hypothetical protein
MRTIRRFTTVAALCTALLAIGAGVANAAANQTWTGQVITSAGSASTATVVWNTQTFFLSLQVKAGTLRSGSCVTVYFDWTAKAHHDSRAVRSCQSGATMSFTFGDPTPSNITGGPDKLGICYGPLDKKGACTAARGTAVPPMDWTPWPDLSRESPCDLSWARLTASGVKNTFVDPNSQRSSLATATTC